MTRPVVHAVAEYAYGKYPEYMRQDDAANGYWLLKFTAGMCKGFERSWDFIQENNPATSRTGTMQLVDAAVIPRGSLAWLGMLKGVDVSALSVELARGIVDAAGPSRLRGSRNAIEAAVLATLSSPTPAPRVWANLSGDEPYLISIVTNTSQTPDAVATLAAGYTEKPAGMVMELQVVEGAIIAELETEFPTILELEAELTTVDSVIAWIPTT